MTHPFNSRRARRWLLQEFPFPGEEVSYAADAVVFAIGIGGMQKLVTACPTLAAASEFRAVMNLKSLDVIATRLWLDRKVNTRCRAARHL